MKKILKFGVCIVFMFLVSGFNICNAAVFDVSYTITNQSKVYEKNRIEECNVTVSNTTDSNRMLGITAVIKNDDGKIVWQKSQKDELGQNDFSYKVPLFTSQCGGYTLSISVYEDYLVSSNSYNYSVVERPEGITRIGLQAGEHMGADYSSVDVAKAGGYSWITLGTRWARVETEKGVFSIKSDYDKNALAAAKKAKENGMEVLFVLGFGNSLYTGGAEVDIPETRVEREAFANYCVYMVEELKKIGVNHFCIWNEPNNYAFTNKKYLNSYYYAELVKATYPKIKAANEDAYVIIGRTAGGCSDNYDYSSGSSYEFCKDLFEKYGLSEYCDAMSIHPYASWHGPVDEIKENFLLSNQIERIRNIMDENGAEDKEIWITEIGNTSGVLTNSDFSIESEEEKAVYNARTAVIIYSTEEIKNTIFYSMVNGGWKFINEEDDTAKKTYFSVSAVINLLEDKKTVSINDENSDYSSYIFKNDDETVVVAWAKGERTKSSKNILISELIGEDFQVAEVRDYYGNKCGYVTKDDEFLLSYKPTYFVIQENSAKVSFSDNGFSVLGNTGKEYVTAKAEDEDGKIIYFDQFFADGEYSFSSKTDSKSQIMLFVNDGNKRVEFCLNVLRGEFSGIKAGNEYITSLESLPDGKIIIELKGQNTTGKTRKAKVVAAYFKGEELIDARIGDALMEDGESIIEISMDNMKVPECTALKLILLEDFMTLKPIADSKTFE